jgi:hypothetical protein
VRHFHNNIRTFSTALFHFSLNVHSHSHEIFWGLIYPMKDRGQRYFIWKIGWHQSAFFINHVDLVCNRLRLILWVCVCVCMGVGGQSWTSDSKEWNWPQPKASKGAGMRWMHHHNQGHMNTIYDRAFTGQNSQDIWNILWLCNYNGIQITQIKFHHMDFRSPWHLDTNFKLLLRVRLWPLKTSQGQHEKTWMCI